MKPLLIIFLFSLLPMFSAHADDSDQIPELTDLEKRILLKSESEFLTAEELPISLVAGRKAEIAARMRCDLTLEGEINEQIAKRLSEQIRMQEDATFCLNSPGGSISASKIIVEAIGKNLGGFNRLSTVVRNGEQCKSACALIFMLGYECSNGRCSTSRFLQHKGILGFHAPYLDNASIEVPSELLDLSYEAALKDFAFILSQGNNESFFDYTERYPNYIIQEMLAKGRKEFFYIDTIEKLLSANIELVGPSRINNDILGSYISLCNNVTRTKSANPYTYVENSDFVEWTKGRLTNTASKTGIQYSMYFQTVHWTYDTAYSCSFAQVPYGYGEDSKTIDLFTKDFASNDITTTENQDILTEHANYDEPHTQEYKQFLQTVEPEMEDLLEHIRDEYNAWLFWPSDKRLSEIAKEN